MAAEEMGKGVRPSTFYGWMAIVLGSVFFVFLASDPLRHDGAWTLVAVWLVVVQLLAIGMLLVTAYSDWKLIAARLAEKRSAEPPPTEPERQKP